MKSDAGLPLRSTSVTARGDWGVLQGLGIAPRLNWNFLLRSGYMITDTQAKISLLVSCFEKMTHMKMPRGVCNPYERTLFELVQAGVTANDLELVLRWLKLRIDAGVRNPECRKPGNLFRCHYSFLEELELARAEMRNQKPAITPKEQVLAQARPIVAQVQPKDAKSKARRADEVAKYWIDQMRQAIDRKDS
jgi:hypothetical protein